MFISRVREFRLKAGISQSELAIRANLSQSHISAVELDSKGVTLATLSKISVALKICVYDLTYYKCEQHLTCEKSEKHHLNCYTGK